MQKALKSQITEKSIKITKTYKEKSRDSKITKSSTLILELICPSNTTINFAFKELP